MSLKTELHSLLASIDSLKPHVRDTGEVQYYAALHQAEVLVDTANEALTPPTEPTEAMQAAGVTALANLPPDTTAAAMVDAILRAALLAGQGA
ncbi:hypothetical protein FQZ97_969250 [compost metagenome]